MVIDHLAKPEIAAGRMEYWRDDFLAASEHPNIYCKLSGMVTEADWKKWTVDDLRPFVDYALECFGPDRLMFGSDWPVCELAASYADVIDALRTLIEPLSAAEKDQIFGKTAADFYRIAPGDGNASESGV